MHRFELRSGVRDGLIYYWFVQYNPFYFFSAACVLMGMYLAASELTDWYVGQLVLAGVMVLYELLLLAGAVLLFRRAKQRRPAVILGLAVVFFLLDPTLRTEGVTALGPAGVVATLLWTFLAVFKLFALRFAFRLRVPLTAWISPMAAVLIVGGMPYLLVANDIETRVLLLTGSCVGAVLLGAAIFFPPQIRCDEKLDEWGRTVLKRAARVAPILWAGFFIYHLITWMGIHEVPLGMHFAVPYLALALLLARSEWTVWVTASCLLGAGALDATAFPTAALAVSAGLAWLAWRKRFSRLYLGAVLCGYLAVWTWGMQVLELPEPSLMLNMLAAIAMLGLGWRFQLYSAIPGALVCLLPGASLYLPQTAFQWGGTLLALGFVKLLGGFAINWYARDDLGAEEIAKR